MGLGRCSPNYLSNGSLSNICNCFFLPWAATWRATWLATSALTAFCKKNTPGAPPPGPPGPRDFNHTWLGPFQHMCIDTHTHRHTHTLLLVVHISSNFSCVYVGIHQSGHENGTQPQQIQSDFFVSAKRFSFTHSVSVFG